MDGGEEAGQVGPRDVRQRVVGHDRIEAVGRQVQPGHVGMDEARPGDGRPGELDLPGGDVDAGDRAAIRQRTGHRHAGTAAQVEDLAPGGTRSSVLASHVSRGGDGRASLHAK